MTYTYMYKQHTSVYIKSHARDVGVGTRLKFASFRSHLATMTMMEVRFMVTWVPVPPYVHTKSINC